MMTQEALDAAHNLAVVRRQVAKMGDQVGFVGITRGPGMQTVEAILDDVTRSMASALTENTQDWDAFVRRADVSWLR